MRRAVFPTCLLNGFRWLPAAGSLIVGFLVAGTLPAGAAEQFKHPVYVGTQACGSCHDGPAMGNQLSHWMHTAHAKAYTSLAKPAARQIAKWSGIPMEPQESAMCLGCHATAAEAEPWEKDDTFFLYEGVQCEKCHGAGSEYMDEQVMRNRAAAIAAGLNMPRKEDCLNCHAEKGSHRIVLGPRKFDLDKAWEALAHPTPPDAKSVYLATPKPPLAAAPNGPAYEGVAVCAECHAGVKFGYQFSKWRLTGHADAWASLSTPRAAELAEEMGVEGDPRTSMQCLQCHTTAFHQPAGSLRETYSLHEGVSCEACHGAGSEHVREVRTQKTASSLTQKLNKVTEQTCAACHANAHGKPFDYAAAVTAIAHPTVAPVIEQEPRYKNPLNLALSPHGNELYVACETSHSVIVVDPVQRCKIAEIPVGGQPMDVTFSPDGQRAFVTNRLDDSLSVIDVATRRVVATVEVGDEPHGVLTDRDGKYLYVLNTSSDNVAVIDTATLQTVKHLAASRSPWSLALSPDGSQIYVTHALSRFIPVRTPSMSEVMVIDTATTRVVDRRVVPASNLLAGVAWHPSGRFALITLLRTKNLVPMTRVHQGWTITNGLGVIWADGRVDQVLLDEPGMCFPDPTDIAVTPDGRLALVTSSTSNRVAVVDVSKLMDLLERATPEQRERIIPNHLGQSAEFLVTYIPTPPSPRGILITPDGNTAFVASTLDDSLTVIDLKQLKTVQRIDLGGPAEITQVRYGERLFNSADITFRRQFACHSCHPDGHIDNIVYDIEPDGLGISPVDNKTLRGILDTAPFKWEGTNPSLSRQCGARLSTFFTRLQPFTPEELAAVDLYVCTIPRPPNRYRPVGAPLTGAQSRGKLLFERTRANDGTIIPKENRCITCHFPPLYTDRRQHDIGSKMPNDRTGVFDTPHLNNIYDSAPYLHNGMAQTLEEIWTRFNPYDTHGVTNDMTKDQLNDLIEYLKTL
jgi:YVTN family beta-propeller protein